MSLFVHYLPGTAVAYMYRNNHMGNRFIFIKDRGLFQIDHTQSCYGQGCARFKDKQGNKHVISYWSKVLIGTCEKRVREEAAHLGWT